MLFQFDLLCGMRTKKLVQKRRERYGIEWPIYNSYSSYRKLYFSHRLLFILSFPPSLFSLFLFNGVWGDFIWYRHMLNWHSYCIDCAIAKFRLLLLLLQLLLLFPDFSVRIDSQFLFRFIDLEMDLHMCVCMVYIIYGKKNGVYTMCYENECILHISKCKWQEKVFTNTLNAFSLFCVLC